MFCLSIDRQHRILEVYSNGGPQTRPQYRKVTRFSSNVLARKFVKYCKQILAVLIHLPVMTYKFKRASLGTRSIFIGSYQVTRSLTAHEVHLAGIEQVYVRRSDSARILHCCQKSYIVLFGIDCVVMTKAHRELSPLICVVTSLSTCVPSAEMQTRNKR